MISALRMGKSDQTNPGSSPAMEPQPTVGAAMPEGGEPLAAASPASPAAAAPASGAPLAAGSNPCGKAAGDAAKPAAPAHEPHGAGSGSGHGAGPATTARDVSGVSRSAASASSMATSAPARSTRFARRCIAASGAHAPARTIGAVPREIVLGVLSLIVWALILVVTIKYVAHPAARRQQRRRRHALPHGACAARPRPRARSYRDAGRDRRVDVLWRLGHHAGHLGAVGRGRPETGRPGARATT